MEGLQLRLVKTAEVAQQCGDGSDVVFSGILHLHMDGEQCEAEREQVEPELGNLH